LRRPTRDDVFLSLTGQRAWGGAVHPPGVEQYIDCVLPGIFVLAIAFGASQTGVAVADDLATGMIDRFHSLPVARSAVLAGRCVADAVRNLFVVALMIGVGTMIGFRFHAGPGAALAAVGLAVAIGIAFSWIFADINPITVTVDALRALCLGGPTTRRSSRRRPGSPASFSSPSPPPYCAIGTRQLPETPLSP
jgi:ABC-2 type transport system permease protein/oleandomycin transport system permease protein